MLLVAGILCKTVAHAGVGSGDSVDGACMSKQNDHDWWWPGRWIGMLALNLYG
jgi:hypothetical protein